MANNQSTGAFTPAELKLTTALVIKHRSTGCKAAVKHDVVQHLLKCGFEPKHSRGLVEVVSKDLLP